MSAPHSEPYDKISVNVPHSLLEKIDEAAAKDRRNRTSWLIYNLEQLLDRLTVEEIIQKDNSLPPSNPVKYPRGRR